MPKSIPSVGAENWGDPLNEHLNQLNNPVTGGFHRWFGVSERPWPNGTSGNQTVDFGTGPTTVNVDDLRNFTGFNELTGIFERWDPTNTEWVIMQPVEQNPLEIIPPGPSGQVVLDTDNTVDTDRYVFLSNANNDLNKYVSVGDLIEITDANDGNKLKLYLVEEVIATNKVRVTEYNPEFVIETNTVTIQLNDNSTPNQIEITTGQTNYFNKGDRYKVSDTASVIMEQISPFEYMQSGFSGIVGTRDIISVYRAPTGANSCKVYKPTIKYNDTYSRVAFATDRFGETSLGKINSNFADELISDINKDLLVSYRYNELYGEQVQSFFGNHARRYAINTTADPNAFNQVCGTQISFMRELASNINSNIDPQTEDLADWNGNFSGEPQALFITYGHNSNLDQTTPSTVQVTSPSLTGIKIQPFVRGGKINVIKNLTINNPNMGTNPGVPDEIWGIIERGNLNATPCKNFISGNTQIGSTAGTGSNGSPAYSAITDKLQVAGNMSIIASAGGTGNADGDLSVANNITYGGTSSQSSDERLKKDITKLDSNEALQTINAISAKSYVMKADDTNKTRYGVIAQELEQVLPDLVSENKEGYKQVNYLDLTAFLIESIKELKQTIETQQKQIDNLTKKLK